MELLYFIIASFLVVIVPGPTVSLIIANSLKSGDFMREDWFPKVFSS